MTEEAITNDVEPDEAVTAEAETNETELETSQASEVEDKQDQEFVLDVEDDQLNKSNFNTESPEYRAFRKEKEAKRRKQKIIDDMVARENAREAELNELKSVVTKLSVGDKPTIESCDFDYSRLEKELDNWYQQQGKLGDSQTSNSVQSANQSVNQADNTTSKSIVLNDIIEYEHFQNEQKLKKSFSDYDESANAFKDEFHQVVNQFLDPNADRESAVNAIIEHGHLANVDMSKAFLALSKVPQLKNQLFDPQVLRNPIAVADILRKAEKSIKPSNSVKSKPPVDIVQGGPVDHKNAKVQQALDKWSKSGSSADYKAYRQAKKLASQTNGNNR